MKRVSSRKSAAVLALPLVCLAICTAIASSPSHPQTPTETRSKQELAQKDNYVPGRSSGRSAGIPRSIWRAAVTEEKNFAGSQKKPFEAKAARQVVSGRAFWGQSCRCELDGPDCTNAGNALGHSKPRGHSPQRGVMVIGQSASVIPIRYLRGFVAGCLN